ncbi:unnamed protein product [Clonostachys rhizophaga]|uniref:O-methylsterigmatocystin oxidoreductase n=1 Tax=Clonostachys rhizophaga TaxID=160324 RepID=A0A9N9VE12_9HYPO|nr:unnamed protein product [Clonostachys rhizophaga]
MKATNDLLLVGIAVTLGSFLVFQQRRRKRPAAPLPPGPRPLPLIGNIFDLPADKIPEYEHWAKHRDKYGPITSVTVLGRSIIVLNDKQIAVDILDKKSLQTGSRPWLEFGFGLCGFENYTGALPYNETFRLHRKLMHQHMGTRTMVESFRDTQQVEVSRMLQLILDEPGKLLDHLELITGSSIIKLTYGYSIDTTRRDPVLDLVTRMMAVFNKVAGSGAWAVDVVPSLKYLPGWFPGAGFKRTACAWKAEVLAAAEKPFQFVQRQMEDNRHRKSYVSNALQHAKDPDDSAYQSGVKFSAAALYGGGSDTTVSTLSFFFLAMLLYPEVLQKGHEEIERVVGSNRLPNFDDRPRLPYVEGIVKEMYRWQPVAALSLPHQNDEDFIYRGYLIPKGALIQTSLRVFANDPNVYHDPTCFKPERYGALYNEPDPKEFAFGFGRRICPGRNFADSFLYLAIVQSLAVFQITKGVDSEGREVEPSLSVLPGIVSRPAEFPFRISPRTKKCRELIMASETAEAVEGSDAEFFERYGLISDGSVGK